MTTPLSSLVKKLIHTIEYVVQVLLTMLTPHAKCTAWEIDKSLTSIKSN